MLNYSHSYPPLAMHSIVPIRRQALGAFFRLSIRGVRFRLICGHRGVDLMAGVRIAADLLAIEVTIMFGEFPNLGNYPRFERVENAVSRYCRVRSEENGDRPGELTPLASALRYLEISYNPIGHDKIDAASRPLARHCLPPPATARATQHDPNCTTSPPALVRS